MSQNDFSRPEDAPLAEAPPVQPVAPPVLDHPRDPMGNGWVGSGASGYSQGSSGYGEQPKPPQPESAFQRKLKQLGPMGAALAAFLAKAKSLASLLYILKLGKILTTGGTMLVSIWVYSLLFGWPFAVGFVVLIFIHEMGHVFVAWRQRLPITAPIFIPFMGALILEKRSAKTAWAQAIMGIGGPAAGTLGALACWAIFEMTGFPIFLGLAYVGFFLNLFNLMPIVPLDGGWIVGAISPWIWLLGLVTLGAMTFTGHMHNPFVWIIVILSLPRVWSLFRPRPGQVQGFLLPPTMNQRLIMGVCYLGLAGFLGVATSATNFAVKSSRSTPAISPRPLGRSQLKPVADLGAQRPATRANG